MGRSGIAQSRLQGGQRRDRDLLGLLLPARRQQRMGQQPATGCHHEAILGLLGGEDAAVGRDPGEIASPKVRHGKAHALIGLGEKPVRRPLAVAVGLPHGELGIGQDAGQQHAELPIGRRLASLPCLLHLTLEAWQVDKSRDLAFPEIVIVHQRVTNRRHLGRLLRSGSSSLARPGRRDHRGGAKHHRVTQQVSTVRGSVPLIEQPERLGRGAIQLTHYATKRRPRPALAPLPAAELRPCEDQVWLAKPVGDLLGLAGGVLLGPAAPLPLVHQPSVGLPAPLSWHRAAPLRGCLEVPALYGAVGQASRSGASPTYLPSRKDT
jgi:hypothetical protein